MRKSKEQEDDESTEKAMQEGGESAEGTIGKSVKRKEEGDGGLLV